jgi:hypothetical protein
MRAQQPSLTDAHLLFFTLSFHFSALRERLQGLIENEKASGKAPRDIGAKINQLLTSDLHRASRKATQKRRASRKVKQTEGAG